MRHTVAFWTTLLLTFGTCHLVASRTLPATWQDGMETKIDFQTMYPSNYQDFGLDYYVVRFGLFGMDRTIQDANVLCYSSSKGLFGYDPDLLSKHLSTPERPVKVFNLSFGFGEGFGFLAEIIKDQDIHDKVLIADITDNTCSYHLSGMAQRCLETTNSVDAYKIVGERWLIYFRDLAFLNRLPTIRLDVNRGWVVENRLGQGRLHRSWSSGKTEDLYPRGPVLHAERGTITYAFDPDGKLKEKFLDECDRRNIRIIFTSIPHKDYDDAWGHAIAERLGRPHVTVDPEGIELFDPNHATANGRQLFSDRLGRKLRDSHVLQTEFVEAQCDVESVH